MSEIWLEAPVDCPGRNRLEPAARAALEARDVDRAELSVTLVDDATIRTLNREHLGHDRPTDVIAFGLWQPGDPVVVGDVYVGLDQALQQAAELGVSAEEELIRLVVHGTLHVTGMDHPEAADERADSAMYRLQERVVADVLSAGPA
ncbi:MAG: rRNA maturation RNase YbeY [Gemmatimonadetes bacterium]|nr:rRNA maturation RNase YbeY [Gemmatimonadota bacterium]NNF39264.1 rRNA maturation RNase YbeY [Gemmatimonadota bacterium]